MALELKPPPDGFAIARCLREMNTDEPGTMLAACLALKRVLTAGGKDLDDFARWVVSWTRFETGLRDKTSSQELYESAMDDQADADAGEAAKHEAARAELVAKLQAEAFVELKLREGNEQVAALGSDAG
jgi:hypothetical protein